MVNISGNFVNRHITLMLIKNGTGTLAGGVRPSAARQTIRMLLFGTLGN